jgi:hypothetical protein
MSFAGQVQQLQYYLGAAEAVSGEPQPVNMEDYGFSSMAELLNLCSAVRPRPSSQVWGSISH